MAKTKTSSTVKDRYNAKTYDEIKLRVYKGRKTEIQTAADAAGESVNAYVVNAVDQRMVRDRGGGIPGCSSGGGHAPDHAEQIKEVSK